MPQPWEEAPIVGKKQQGASVSNRAPDPAAPWLEAPRIENDNPLISAPTALGKGINVGLANALGAPVDIANAALGMVGLGSERPAMGSQMLRDWISSFRLPGKQDPAFGYRDIEDIPESYRPIAKAGEVAGESIPFAAAPLAKGLQLGAKSAKGLTAPIVEAARRTPGRFTAAEATGIGGAGIGRAGAERYAPGDETIGMTAEVVGGVASPIALVNRGIQNAGSLLGRLRSTVSHAGRRRAAGTAVADLATTAGEQPESLVRSLRQPGVVPGAQMTAGMKTGSPALIGLEQQLARKIPGLDNAVRAKIRQTTEALNQAYRNAIEGGDAGLVQQLAQERQRWFQSLLDARVTAAQQRAEDALQKVRPKSGKASSSVRARNILEDALGDARSAERSLWERVPHKVEVQPRALAEAHEAARARLLEEEALPAPVEAFVKRAKGVLGKEGAESITSGDLLRFRSRLLAMQRNMRSSATPDWTVHRALGDLADAVLDDLADIPGTEPARAFSRRLHDLFSRGEVGKLMGFEATGGSRVSPEMTLEQAMGAGKTRGSVASRQIEEAAQLEGLPGDLARRSTVEEQSDLIRNMLMRTVDEKTGQVNPRALATFRRENADLLSRFPGLDQQIDEAGKAQDLLERAAQLRQRAQKAARQRAVFSKAADLESPSKAVATVLRGPRPASEYRQLARMAAEAGEDGLAGLRQATFDHLFGRATREGLISGQEMRALLESRPTAAHKSLIEIMTDTGVLSEKQRDNLMRVVDETERIESALRSGRRVADVLEDATALEDLLTRIIGANIGGAGAAGQMTGAPLVAAQAGSKFARRLTQQIPAQRTSEILAEAVEDPNMMAALLSEGKTPRERRQMARQVNAFLLQTLLGEDQEERAENFVTGKVGFELLGDAMKDLSDSPYPIDAQSLQLNQRQ